MAADQATGRLQIVSHSAQSGGWPCAIVPVMLTAVTDVPSRSTLRVVANGEYVVPRTSRMEPTANRTQVDAFNASFQALLENILLPN